MANATQYEYGQLQFRKEDAVLHGPAFFFNYAADQDVYKKHIHQVLNDLAVKNWEPILFYDEWEGEERLPSWILRRLVEGIS